MVYLGLFISPTISDDLYNFMRWFKEILLSLFYVAIFQIERS